MSSELSERAEESSTQVSSWFKWSETALITLATISFGYWTRPEDPFYLNEPIPWLIIAPLLTGLRYGFFAALLASVFVLLAAAKELGTNDLYEFPWSWAAGILSLSLLAGEFRDYWGRKLERAQAVANYKGRRLDEFTRYFYLLKVSHDRLEQQLAGSSGSLRESLRRLYGELSFAGAGELNDESAGLMLGLLARYGQLQTAAIYGVEKGECGSKPLASIGDFGSVQADDPLILHALEQSTLVSVQTELRNYAGDLNTDLLLALPLADSSDEVVAVCLVKAMPFFSFQSRVLRLLAILAGHMADVLTQNRVVDSKDAPELRALLFQAERAGHDASRFNMPAVAFGLEVDNQNATHFLARIEYLRRGLDLFAFNQDGQSTRIVLLIPLTDELGLAGYIARLDEDLTHQIGASLHDLARTETLVIEDSETSLKWIRSFLSKGQRDE